MRKAFFEDTLRTVSRIFAVLVVLVLVFIAFSGVRFVKSGEVAVVLRFGRIVGDTPETQIRKPGLLFCFPYFIDEVVTVPTGSVMQQTVSTYYTDGTIADWGNGYLMTGDQNIVLVNASLKYTITDAVRYALHVSEPEKIINACVSNAMLETAARTGVDDILKAGKEKYAAETLTAAQQKLDEVEAGITLQAIELTEVTMPVEVRDVYEQVNAASVEASTYMESALQYRNTYIPMAEAKAHDIVTSANSANATAVSAATSDLATFWGVLDEYNATPDVVRVRIYSEKMSKALATIGTIRVVGDDNSKIIIN